MTEAIKTVNRGLLRLNVGWRLLMLKVVDRLNMTSAVSRCSSILTFRV